MDSNDTHQCPLCPSGSHGSVDRQRNDRLGRIRRRQLFEHRRAILRGYTNSDTHANTYSDGDGDGDGHSNRYVHAHSNGNVHTYAYGNSDRNSHADGIAHVHTQLHDVRR